MVSADVPGSAWVCRLWRWKFWTTRSQATLKNLRRQLCASSILKEKFSVRKWTCLPDNGRAGKSLSSEAFVKVELNEPTPVFWVKISSSSVGKYQIVNYTPLFPKLDFEGFSPKIMKLFKKNFIKIYKYSGSKILEPPAGGTRFLFLSIGFETRCWKFTFPSEDFCLNKIE